MDPTALIGFPQLSEIYIGEISQRTLTFTLKLNASLLSGTIGVQEFMDLCQAIGRTTLPHAVGDATFHNCVPIMQNGVLTHDITPPVH
jgi:hypothetical protein